MTVMSRVAGLAQFATAIAAMICGVDPDVDSAHDEARAEASVGFDHYKDEHCTVGDDGCCAVCGVSHGERCGACYKRAFHTDDCPESDLNIGGSDE